MAAADALAAADAASAAVDLSAAAPQPQVPVPATGLPASPAAQHQAPTAHASPPPAATRAAIPAAPASPDAARAAMPAAPASPDAARATMSAAPASPAATRAAPPAGSASSASGSAAMPAAPALPATGRAAMPSPSAASAHAVPQPPYAPMADAPTAPVSPAAAAARAAMAPTATADAHADAQQPPAEGQGALAPTASPAAPARVPGTPSIASTGEDMSWFDDAPTPEFKPQRKKVAAPEQPDAAPQQRPAPAAPPMRPAPAATAAATAAAARPPAPPRSPGSPGSPTGHTAPAPMDPTPAYDDTAMDEPPSWFDDDQPAAAGNAAPVASHAAPGPGQIRDEDIATMDWPALQAAITSCTRCPRCETRQQAIPGRGDEQATWIALDTAPGQTEDAEGYPFADAPGHLLDNMLKAVGQTTEKGAYLTSLVKCHAPQAPSAEELQACRPYLERELQLTQAKVIVAFGHSTGKGLLGSAARGRIMLSGSVPVVATYHPSDLLKKPEDKAKAWQDLCLAKAAHAGRR